ncbi:MAG: response regulator transcription factor, partial [Chloroflexota bacterium]|nr:response regulator transcription factor [Chloroflexota bacterium]
KTGERRDPYDLLTDREREILHLVAAGHSNREVAQMLNISEHTVHNHRARLMEKLGIHDRLELLKYAIRRGIITADM